VSQSACLHPLLPAQPLHIYLSLSLSISYIGTVAYVTIHIHSPGVAFSIVASQKERQWWHVCPNRGADCKKYELSPPSTQHITHLYQ
jgi:hypothetical protein